MTNPLATGQVIHREVIHRQVIHLDFISLAATATQSAIEDLIQEAATLNQLPSVQLVGVIRADPDRGLKPSASNMEPPGSKPPLSRGGVINTATPDESTNTSPASTSANTPMPGVSTPGTATPIALASDFDLAFFFVLDGFASLEPFGTNPLYTRFLQGKVARLLKGFAGADVALTAPFPEVAPYAACLALAAPDHTYDWEVRAALESWATTSKDSKPHRAEPPLSRGGVINTPTAAPGDAFNAPNATSSPPPASSTAVGLAIGERQRYRGCVLLFTTTETTPDALADRRFESSLIAGRARRL